MPDLSRHRNHRRGPSRAAPAGCPEGAYADVPSGERIHVCPRCRSELIQPIACASAADGRWRIEVRCPDCSHRSAGTYPRHVLDRFEARLDRATAGLLDQLASLERDRVEREAARFCEALAHDLILPEDFAQQ